MTSKKTSLSDRISGENRMARAVAAHLPSLQEEVVPVKDNTLNNTNTKDTTLVLEKPKEKPLVKNKGLVKGNTNTKSKTKANDKGKVNVKVKTKDNLNTNANDIPNTNANTNTNTNVIPNTNDNEKVLTFTEMLINKIGLIEESINEEAKPISLIMKKEKIKFDEKYPIMSFPARKELQELIEIVSKRTGLKKYQIVELAILKGLRNTVFE